MAELERFGFLNKELECMDPEKRKAWVDGKIKELVDFAYRNSPYMRRLMDEAGVSPGSVKSAEDLYKVPVVRKRELPSIQAKNPPFGGLLAVPVEELAHIYSSPGPIYDPEGREEDYWGWREVLVGAGFVKGDVVINTFSYHMTPGGLMFDGALREMGCTVVPTGISSTEDQVRLLSNLPVTGFIGMASFLLRIAEKAEAMGVNPKDFGLKVALSTAEVLTEDTRERVEETFGLKLRQCFGVADLGGCAYECYYKNGMHISTRVFVQICDPETGNPLPYGEVGEVVVTPLLNRVYPIVRFGTGDLSYIIPEERCPCGRTLPKLGRILGRVDDVVKVKGLFVYPHQVEQVLKEFSLKGRLVVDRDEGRDVLTLLIEGGEELVEGVSRRFTEVTKLKAKVEVVESLEEGKVIEDRRFK